MRRRRSRQSSRKRSVEEKEEETDFKETESSRKYKKCNVKCLPNSDKPDEILHLNYNVKMDRIR